MITVNEVQQMIEKLEAAGEISMKEEKYLALAKAFKELAAENVALKQYALDCFNAVENWNSWADKEDQIHNDIKTPATDRIVAGIKADGVEEFAEKLRIPGDDQFFDALAKGVALAADDFAQQLREGADK